MGEEHDTVRLDPLISSLTKNCIGTDESQWLLRLCTFQTRRQIEFDDLRDELQRRIALGLRQEAICDV